MTPDAELSSTGVGGLELHSIYFWILHLDIVGDQRVQYGAAA